MSELALIVCHVYNINGASHLSDINEFVSCCVSDRFVIIPLHSLMPTVNQTQVSIPLFFLCALSL